MINFQNTTFVQSSTAKLDGSVTALPEVIFIGRSNVGKSSLINAVINRKNYAYTSKKPGLTKLLNYFNVDNAFYLVDAPGYGYARTKRQIDASFASIMDEYFKDNVNLKQIYLLLDARRELSAEDLEFIEFVRFHNLPITVIFTKADKVNQKEKAQALKVYNLHFKEEAANAIFTSSLAKTNINVLQNHISKVINDL